MFHVKHLGPQFVSLKYLAGHNKEIIHYPGAAYVLSVAFYLVAGIFMGVYTPA